MLKYNTLYQSLKKVSAEWHAGHVEWEYCWNYLKFYKDGTFIQASIVGDSYDEINKSFTKDATYVTKGHFELKKNRVVNLDFGTIQINGAINKDGSIIINGKQAWDLYSLVE